jgi:hypothetical protein
MPNGLVEMDSERVIEFGETLPLDTQEILYYIALTDQKEIYYQLSIS